MIQFNQSQRTLLQILGDGSCHSGNKLGQASGITRSAIWKQINQLVDSGIPILRIPHQGYKLPNPLILLDEQKIAQGLEEKGFSKPFKVWSFTSIDSTNRYLKDLPISSKLDICCTEIQTQGRGRFGRHWYSPFGENIYCSSRWSLTCDLGKLSGLSMVTSLAVLATLNELNPSTGIRVKWPNDLLWGDKKLSGSLIEIIAESNSNVQIIIGIGINVNTDTKNEPLPDKPWCSLYEVSGQRYNRNLLIVNLIINLELYLNKFITKGFEAFLDEWNSFDYLREKYISVTQGTRSISGIARGVNNAGLLILEDENKMTHFLSSGDTTLMVRGC